MSRTYTITGKTDQVEHLSAVMAASYTETTVPSIVFYDDDDEIVTPSAGTVEFLMSFDKNTFLSVDSGKFLASEAYNSDRQMPNAKGAAIYAKVVLNGIAGASRFSLKVHRS